MKAEVLIDISRLLARARRGRLPTGVDRVSLRYVQHWGDKAKAVVHQGQWRRILSFASSQALFALLLEPPTPGFSERMNRVVAKACVPPWPRQDAHGAPAFYLGHSGMELPGFARWIAATKQKPVYVVYDLIPVTHAEYCRAGERPAHVRRLRAMLQTGAGLLAISQATFEAVEDFARSEGLALPPMAVAPLAAAAYVVRQNAGATAAAIAALPVQPPAWALPNCAAFAELSVFPALPKLPEAPYFVILGTIEPRKNHLLLLNVWRELVLRLGAAAPHLLVIGQRGWECENVIDMLERCLPIQPFLHEIPACSDSALAHCLGHAKALLFPSFTEGYGMPLVEALALGTPVIASDLPVFREIAGSIPELLCPTDGPGWMQAIIDYARPGSNRRAAQLQRMQGFVPPTWQSHFAQVDALLERLA